LPTEKPLPQPILSLCPSVSVEAPESQIFLTYSLSTTCEASTNIESDKLHAPLRFKRTWTMT